MSDEPSWPRAPERLPSGIAGLDLVLRGGFLHGGTYIVQGAPGTGKTILGNQICFNHVKAGGRAIYVTLLAESHARMFTNIRSMGFFDAAAIPDAIYYVSAFRELETAGLGGLFDVVRREVRDHKATLLVIDGLVAAEEVAPSDREFKKFIHELQVLTGLMPCTTFLLTNGSGKAVHPEHTMVDGLLVLAQQIVGRRAMRHVEIPKFRGSGYLEGRHSVEITDEGVVVHPRCESWLGRPSSAAPEPEPDEERLPLGIPGLDRMLGGGLPVGSTTMVLGPPGSGKTLVGLQFVAEGARRGEPGLVFGLYETPPRLRRKAEQAGMRRAFDGDAVEMRWHPPVEHSVDGLVADLVAAVRRRGVRRLFFDGYGALAAAPLDLDRVGPVFAALTSELRASGVTTIFSAETRSLFSADVELPVREVSTIVENFLVLRYAEVGSSVHRLVSILKVRESPYDSSVREFRIGKEGIVVAASPRSGARSSSEPRPARKGRRGKRA